jgi:hypothetical protein
VATFQDKVITPIVKILAQQQKEGMDVKQFIANAESIRKILVEQYEYFKEELDLTKLPIEEKNKLWEESKICEDRHAWCKAVWFWEAVNHYQ